MSDDDADFEAKAAAFTRANHHRWAIAYGIGGLACLVGAAVFTIIELYAPASSDPYHAAAQRMKLWIGIAIAIVAGCGMLWRSIAVWRGTRDDVGD
jgi:hypothetical protein